MGYYLPVGKCHTKMDVYWLPFTETGASRQALTGESVREQTRAEKWGRCVVNYRRAEARKARISTPGIPPQHSIVQLVRARPFPPPSKCRSWLSCPLRPTGLKRTVGCQGRSENSCGNQRHAQPRLARRHHDLQPCWYTADLISQVFHERGDHGAIFKNGIRHLGDPLLTINRKPSKYGSFIAFLPIATKRQTNKTDRAKPE